MDWGINSKWSKADIESQGIQNSVPTEVKKSEFRTVLPQILASSAKNLLLLDLGMTLGYPTIAIPELLQSNDDLRFTGEEASWFGSITFICQPLGSVISGFLFEPLGRKKAMLLVNIPHIIGWFLIYFAKNIIYMYLAAVILGIGIGFMEAPIITYVGEISQPKWRGILAAYAGIFVAMGFLLVNFLGTATTWRTAAAICSSVPMLAFLAILQVPESPIWLLSKGRLREAERSLCWLRGWVEPSIVQQELSRMIQHSEMHNKKEIIIIKSISAETEKQDGADTLNRKEFSLQRIRKFLGLNYLFQKSTMQPLILVTVFFIFHHGSGITSTRPYLVEIFKEFGTIINGNWITVVEVFHDFPLLCDEAREKGNILNENVDFVPRRWELSRLPNALQDNMSDAFENHILLVQFGVVISSAVGILGNIVGMLWLRISGKRKLSIISALTCVIFNMSICIYGFLAFNSKDSWILISLFIMLNFSWSFGIGQIPWMLTSEIFPFYGRGVASGIAAAGSYIFGFIFTKTYYNLHQNLTLMGTFGFFGIFTLLGFTFLYCFLPETEGKTLSEIEIILSVKFDKILGRRKCTTEIQATV